MTSIAFENHSSRMVDPSKYIDDKRPRHPLDDLLILRPPSDCIDKCGSGEPCDGDHCPLPENNK